MASTELATVPQDKFMALRADLDDVTEAIEANLDGADLTERDLLRLTVPSGTAKTYRWELPTLDGGSENVDEISGIIVLKRSSRAWWPRSIDDGGPKIPPSCASSDARTGYGKIWATKDDPDPDGDAVVQVCKQCPHAQFGSANGGDGRGQACSQSEQLFLLMETGFLPVVVSAPAMSLAPFKKYMVALSSHGILFSNVETILGLEKATNAGGTDFARITFRLGGHLSDEARAAAKAYSTALTPQFEAVAQQMAADVQPVVAPTRPAESVQPVEHAPAAEAA